ncbi:hypothetical protein CRG98_011375 [Punica granatum]|uniref:Uncharacterized protein n=1 Tax=Punica granatum TaxID=22663 RepID=A0A2I0KIG5_PUNGR|nr:hypothetical protein CRG98_011375 [Punica granatum]
MRASRSRGLGVSIFPWGRVIDTHEKESPLPIYNRNVEGRKTHPTHKLKGTKAWDAANAPRLISFHELSPLIPSARFLKRPELL